ncbi:MAG: Fur family transcriptional regulator [Acidimicrobiales bacterium]
MTTIVHSTAADRLRGEGQRYTTQRRDLVDLLVAVEQPLTIPQLLDRQPGLSQSSAYRNLAVLERAGVVHRIAGGDGFARYELTEDLTGHHHHLVCSDCGEVVDFEMSDAVERDLEAALHRAARRAGFQVSGHRLDLVGTCASCS